MPTVPLPQKRFDAHTVSLEEDAFARTILLDGRSSPDDLDALALQFAIDPQDGEDPYLAIPVQRFASDGGLRKFIIRDDTITVLLDGEAGERLAGIYQWTITVPIERMKELLSFSARAFERHRELLEIEEPNQSSQPTSLTGRG